VETVGYRTVFHLIRAPCISGLRTTLAGTALFVIAESYLQLVMAGLFQAAADASLPPLPALFHPDRWLLWLGLVFVLAECFAPSSIAGALEGEDELTAWTEAQCGPRRWVRARHTQPQIRRTGMKVGIIGLASWTTLAARFLKQAAGLRSARASRLSSGTGDEESRRQVKSSADAAAFGEVVVLAVAGDAALKAQKQRECTRYRGKMVIDACNPIGGGLPFNGVLSSRLRTNR
jgi:hypothetical protein